VRSTIDSMTEDRPPQAPGPAAGPAAAPPPPPPPLAPPAGPGGPGGPGSTGGPTGPAEPPPLTAFAWRNGLVRPTQGRLLAGVSGAFARATNTDPVLWRVVIAVLTIFAGIGALVYVVAWLILPADGDTASPIEALAGRGRSGTSTALTIVGSIIVVFALAAYISEPFRATPLVAAALLGGVLLLLLRDQRGRPRTANPVWPPPAAAPFAPGPPPAPGAMAYGPPPAPAYPVAGPPLTPPPFAPHGPFVPPPPPPPPLAPPVMPRPPKPKPPRSRLGLLTVSVALLVIGTMAALNLTGTVHIAPLVFLGVALGIVGLGLFVGTWFGRARGLIALGILLSLMLGAGTASDWNETGRGWFHHTGTVTWAPASVDTIQPSYRQGVGDATLDLSSVDFSTTTRPVTIDVQVDLGTLRVIVPSNVDVTVDAKVDVGQARVFRESWDGLGQQSRTVTDLGADGAGGGQLHLSASVDVGDLEVTR